jgi:hypothetical protein
MGFEEFKLFNSYTIVTRFWLTCVVSVDQSVGLALKGSGKATTAALEAAIFDSVIRIRWAAVLEPVLFTYGRFGVWKNPRNGTAKWDGVPGLGHSSLGERSKERLCLRHTLILLC